jgi:hypothetical protein
MTVDFMRPGLDREAADKFHAHLDVCPQCADHPFHLCAEGHRLLLATATYKKDSQ